ncbi:MAG TPA: lycopene cyclase domain-containing protein [Elusimicrobiota bacterium]|nr:lycopene cyclase domain-containing protein [Elusimicrobiota bacterium]
MPERRDYRRDPTTAADTPRPRYLQVLVGVFILPLLVLWRWLFRGANAKAVFLGFALVTLIGWAWSITLSAQQWWIFPRKWLIGIWLLPNLPLEEMLFYPMVMLFMIGFYNVIDRARPQTLKSPWSYRLYLYSGTLVFAVLAFLYRDEKPYYLYSHFIVYNGLAIVLCEAVWRYVNPRAMALITGFMFLVGLIWDYFAFKYDWWIYNPIMGIKFWGIPVEDVNFYLYAPPAGLSLYLLAVKYTKKQDSKG